MPLSIEVFETINPLIFKVSCIFNILRIYRRNNNKKQCKLITKDMRYIDKKYGLNKTKDIC